MSFTVNNSLKESRSKSQFKEVVEFWFYKQITWDIPPDYHFISCISLGILFKLSFLICRVQTLIKYSSLNIKIIFNFSIKLKKITVSAQGMSSLHIITIILSGQSQFQKTFYAQYCFIISVIIRYTTWCLLPVLKIVTY